MNPFAALDVSDDEEQKFTTATGAEQKPPKRCNSPLMQPISKGSRPRKPRSAKPSRDPSQLLESTKTSQRELEKTPERKGTTK